MKSIFLILLFFLIITQDCFPEKLSSKQIKFTKLVGQLIEYATSIGYDLTFGDAYAKTGHCKDSLHYKRLAIDLNLFINGKYMTKTSDHLPLGKFWESLGGTWGGRFKKADGNHYQF